MTLSMIISNITTTNITTINRTATNMPLIYNSNFQMLLQHNLLLLAFTTVFLIYNSTIFPRWLNFLMERRYPVVPTKGNLIFISNIGVGLVMSVLFLTILLLLYSSPPSYLPLCCEISKHLWGFLGGVMALAVLDALRVWYCLFPL